MTTTLDYGCSCGALRGKARLISAKTGNHLVCMCDDCQTFANFLAPTEVMDSEGGTRIFQLTPCQLTIDTGKEHLRCVRLGPKGLLRWYAGCCKTPLGNSVPWAGMPFVGVPTVALDPTGQHDDALGPVRARINARFSPAGAAAQGHPKAPLGLIGRTIRMLAMARLRGRHKPTPFFGADGKPVVEPDVLTREQRDALRP